MSSLENSQYLEILKMNFDTAITDGNYHVASSIITEVRDLSPDDADSLQEILDGVDTRAIAD